VRVRIFAEPALQFDMNAVSGRFSSPVPAMSNHGTQNTTPRS
jgi:hypothetical protein